MPAAMRRPGRCTLAARAAIAGQPFRNLGLLFPVTDGIALVGMPVHRAIEQIALQYNPGRAGRCNVCDQLHISS
jgi:hypothetical protein